MPTLSETRSIVNSELLALLEHAYKEGYSDRDLVPDSKIDQVSPTNLWLTSRTRKDFLFPECTEQLREG